nr:PREDICTED: uncharacterized protein LOC109037324 [Bemisia tabaci]
MFKSARCDGITLKSMVMNVTFLLVTFLILEQAYGKKRVVIHVPNKINNIHHHHVKKVIVYKPVPVKCHHEEDKHDWQEGWESTQKDEWLDKRPSIPIPVKHPGHPGHPGWPIPELIKTTGYVSGERISSDTWDATGTSTAAVKYPKILEEDEADLHPLPSKKRPLPPIVNDPSDWKLWSPGDVTPHAVAPPKNPPPGPRLKAPVVQPPKEHIVTYRVVKKKVTKPKVKKPPLSSTEVKPKPILQSHYSNQGVKTAQYPPHSYVQQPSYEEDMYMASSSIKPHDYPKTQQSSLYSSPYSGHNNPQPPPQPVLSQNVYHNNYSPSSTVQPYYDQDPYFTSSSRPYVNQNYARPYYDQADAYSAPKGHGIQNEQEPFLLNPHNIKALLDQNVQVSESSRRKPSYDLNIHNPSKVRPNSSSYQMRYSHLNSTTPTAYLINH